MGRIYDALRRAEQERQRGVAARPEPAVVVDTSERLGPEPVADHLDGRSDQPAANPFPDPVEGTPAEPAGFGVEASRGELHAVPAHDWAALPTDAALPARDAGTHVAPRVPGLIAVADPSSPAAERLRAIRSRILRLFEEHGYRSLLITSPGRGEGKSTTAANLALLLAAEINRRVLLVDGDLRKPALNRLFGIAQAPGLSDVVHGRTLWPQVIARAPWNDLAVMPAGPRVESATELLNGPAARQFFRDVRAAYDFVVIDAPPVLPVADAVVLAGLVDCTLLVVRAGYTPREAVGESLDALARTRLLGVVLNAVPDQPLARRSYYAY